jgi:hypothetical protein
MRKLGLLLALCTSLVSGFAQVDSVAMKYANTITAGELRAHLEILASDEYEGRETGLKGQKMAAEYISSYFKLLGIAPCVDGSYYQEFPLKTESSLNSTLSVGGLSYEFMDGYFFFPGFDQGLISADEVVFAGYGIDTDGYNDYQGLDVKGKVVMVLDGEPFSKDGKSYVSGEQKAGEWTTEWRNKRDAATDRGAIAIIVVKKDYDSYVGRIKYWLTSPGMRLDYDEKRGEEVLPTFFVSEKIAKEISASAKSMDLAAIRKKISKKGKSIHSTFKSDLKIDVKREEEKFTAENVLAFIPGSDPELKDEVVIITAHYDHVGVNDKGEVYNGADDDGSGTVTALELAQAFKAAYDEGNGPRRSVLVMTVSGEEKGLLGSEWYAEYPIFPLEKTVCDLNIDMIGRTDAEHDHENYIYLIGSDKLSTELHELSENANSTYTNLELDYTYNRPEDPNRFYYRSDHYNFAKNNIPVIFYFSGVHEDYHQPGDDVEKILFDKMAVIGKLVFYTAWEVANRDKKLVVDVENDFE